MGDGREFFCSAASLVSGISEALDKYLLNEQRNIELLKV